MAILLNINQANGHIEAMLDADQRQVDAVVLLGTAFREETLREHTLQPAAPPLFVLARESASDRVTAVSCDAVGSMTEIGDHLWIRGYRRPGFMSGPRTLSTALGRMQRFAAYWKARGLPDIPEMAAGAYHHKAAGEAMTRYLSTTPSAERIDVLMCENDALALGAMDVARVDFGLSGPGELAFVGYDGLDLAAGPSYHLTTYEQPMNAMDDRLVAMIVGRTEAISLKLPGRPIIRRST